MGATGSASANGSGIIIPTDALAEPVAPGVLDDFGTSLNTSLTEQPAGRTVFRFLGTAGADAALGFGTFKLLGNQGFGLSTTRTGYDVTLTEAAPGYTQGFVLPPQYQTSAGTFTGATSVSAPVFSTYAITGLQSTIPTSRFATSPYSGMISIGPYSSMADSPYVAPGKFFTPSQKAAIYQSNMSRNSGLVRSDLDGQVLVLPIKSQKGVSPAPNEAQIDHIIPRNPNNPYVEPGSNSFGNAQVLSREQNRTKSNE